MKFKPIEVSKEPNSLSREHSTKEETTNKKTKDPDSTLDIMPLIAFSILIVIFLVVVFISEYV